MNEPSTAVVIGAGGGLGMALCRQWQQRDEIERVIAVSRQPLIHDAIGKDPKTHCFQSDYSEASIEAVCSQLQALEGSITRVCICNGILHNDRIRPEKRIEEFDPRAYMEVLNVNSAIPLLWLQALLPLVRRGPKCVITVFSARIGSIGDNRSGGWYSYRASKAALNMLLKTAAIEYARRAGNVKLIAFQPGTTDTFLSRPFQASVRPENLLTPEFVAHHLVNIMNQQTIDGELSFIDWENKAIAW